MASCTSRDGFDKSSARFGRRVGKLDDESTYPHLADDLEGNFTDVGRDPEEQVGLFAFLEYPARLPYIRFYQNGGPGATTDHDSFPSQHPGFDLVNLFPAADGP